MDQHEDDISILSPDEEGLVTDHDSNGIPQFFIRTSKSDITPASVHAFQTAYGDLKKRYNDLEQRNRTLRRQIRGNNIYRMASENGFPNQNNDYPHYGTGGDISAHAQGAAAMADPASLDDQVKQGYINHLTQQLNLAHSQRQALEDELKMMRQKLEDLRQKYNKCVQENTRLHTDLANVIGVQDRHPGEVLELKTEIRRLHQLLQAKQQVATSVEMLMEPLLLSAPKRFISRPTSLDEEDGGVVSLSEFRRVKEQMEKCQENMVTLRKVVEQQNGLIKNLQSDRSSKESSTSSNQSRTSDVFGNETNLLDVAISSPPNFNMAKQLQQPLSPRMSRPFQQRVMSQNAPYSQAGMTEEARMAPVSGAKLGDDLCTDRVPDSPLSLPNSPVSPMPNTDGLTFDPVPRWDRYGQIAEREQNLIGSSQSVPPLNMLSTQRQRSTGVESQDRYRLGMSANLPTTQNIYNDPIIISPEQQQKNDVESSVNVNMYGKYGQNVTAVSSPLSPTSASYSEVLTRSKGIHDRRLSARNNVDKGTDRTTVIARNMTAAVQNSTLPSSQTVRSSSGPTISAPLEAPTMQVCPICAKDFTHLSMGDFQNHVFDCYDNTDSGEIVMPQVSVTDEMHQPSRPPATKVVQKKDGIPRICPVCETDFHTDIPQELYEKHVYEHFGEATIVDDFAILNP